MKIKALVPNVLAYGNEEGKELEVNKATGEHLIACGVAEQVKAEEKTEEVPEKNTKKVASKNSPKKGGK